MNQASLDRSHIQSVRQFNRFYTRRIGLLQESWLQSPYTLTEVRVLYELSARKRTTAAELGRDLGLDAGYLSRMMRRFEDGSLVARVRSAEDKRQSFVSLTAKGRKTFAPLERRQIEEVGAMLKSVAAPDRYRLLEAMGVIQQALNGTTPAAQYRLRSHRPGDMGWAVHRHGVLYWREWGYDERFEALVAGIVSEFIEKFDPDRERCWIAERNGEMLGSIFLVCKSHTVAKLRLLLVEPSARGMGIGKRLVSECVNFARSAGYRKIVLWTQSELAAARHLYEQAGFRLVSEKKHSSWSREDLVAESWELKLA
jgi:DNA-binding MarR family transcriptional regulator/N-acetylglutamate synthase-like GNAT family acetyltransferase